MPTPIDFVPVSLTSSNILLTIWLQADQMNAADAEINSVNADRNIATARPDTLQPNWGTLLQVAFDPSFTTEQYRNILLGTIKSRLEAPFKQCLIDMVHAYAPSATVVIRDYFNDAARFIGPGVPPDPTQFFILNSPLPNNTWNNPLAEWMPGVLLRSLGFDPFGTQVQVVSVANTADIRMLTFVPPALAFVTPAHQFIALISQQEIPGP
jgi:hypothetical protein